MGNGYFHALSQCFSLLSSSRSPVYFWPGDVSVCCLYQVAACLFVCSGVSSLLHPCCCVHETVLNDGKAETKQSPRIPASDLATTVMAFRLSGFLCQSSPATFCFKCCKNCVCCLYSKLKLSLANLFM